MIHEVDKLARRLPALDIILIQGQIESFFAARNSRRKLKQTQKSIRFSPGKEWSRRKRHLRSLKGGIRGRPERAGDRGADVVVDEEDDLRRRLHLALAPQARDAALALAEGFRVWRTGRRLTAVRVRVTNPTNLSFQVPSSKCKKETSYFSN